MGSAPTSLRKRFVNRRAQGFSGQSVQHHAVDEDRRRAVDAVNVTVFKVVFDFRGVGAAIKRGIKTRAIQTDLCCVFLQRGNIEGALPLEKQSGIFEKLSLRGGRICCFGGLSRVNVF